MDRGAVTGRPGGSEKRDAERTRCASSQLIVEGKPVDLVGLVVEAISRAASCSDLVSSPPREKPGQRRPRGHNHRSKSAEDIVVNEVGVAGESGGCRCVVDRYIYLLRKQGRKPKSQTPRHVPPECGSLVLDG